MTSPPLSSSTFYTDGAFNPATAPFGWASVVDHQGHDLIEAHHKDAWFELFLSEHKAVIPDHMVASMGPKAPDKTRRVLRTLFDDVKVQQNNGAELVAMLIAQQIVLHRGPAKTPCTINCDSQIILRSWSGGSGGNPHTPKRKAPSPKDTLIAQCRALRVDLEAKGHQFIHIPGKDNLADMGYHSSSSSKKRKVNDHPLPPMPKASFLAAKQAVSITKIK